MTAKKTTLGLVPVIVSAFLATSASALEGEGGKDRFQRADTNGDGMVERAEMLDQAKKKFLGFDADGNGFLSLEELPQTMPGRMQHRGRMGMPPSEDFKSEKGPGRMHFIARMDKDGDEQVSFDEFSSRAVRKFERLDTDGDGAVSRAEVEAAKQKRRDCMKERRKDRHRGRDEG